MTLQNNDCCESDINIARHIIHVVFVILQLLMMFKYSNLIVNRNIGIVCLLSVLKYKYLSWQELFLFCVIWNTIIHLLLGLARWAFMHCIGSSLCFWINTICNETVDSLVEKLTKDHNEDHVFLEYYKNFGYSYGIKMNIKFIKIPMNVIPAHT